MSTITKDNELIYFAAILCESVTDLEKHLETYQDLKNNKYIQQILFVKNNLVEKLKNI